MLLSINSLGLSTLWSKSFHLVPVFSIATMLQTNFCNYFNVVGRNSTLPIHLASHLLDRHLRCFFTFVANMAPTTQSLILLRYHISISVDNFSQTPYQLVGKSCQVAIYIYIYIYIKVLGLINLLFLN
jgi:hypothetical protein